MKNLLFKPDRWLILLAVSANAAGYDYTESLANNVGATDFYRITCPADTRFMNLELIDQSAVVQPLPQWLNLKLSKNDLTAAESTGIKADESAEVSLSGGNGKYTLTVDNQGTNPDLKKPQSYRYEYQCIYSDGSGTVKQSGKKTIKNGTANKPSKAKFTINCPAKKNPALDVDRLYARLTNLSVATRITRSEQILTAQLTRDIYDSTNTKILAANAIDRNGDENYGDSIKVDGGKGDYFLTVHHTGTQSAQDNSKVYSFRYGCMTETGTDAGQPVITLLQNN